MVFTKLLLENALAIQPCNCEAASEPLLPKVACCIPVLPLRYIGKCAARVLKCSALIYKPYLLLHFGHRNDGTIIAKLLYGTTSPSMS